MSENKEYVSRADELGNIHISEEVLAAIAAAAAMEVEGVSSLAANLGRDIADLLGKKNLAKGVRVKMEDDRVEVELSVLMTYGHTIPEIGKAVQENVKKAIETMSGLDVHAVDVHVSGISFEREQRANAELDEQHRKMLEKTAENNAEAETVTEETEAPASTSMWPV